MNSIPAESIVGEPGIALTTKLPPAKNTRVYPVGRDPREATLTSHLRNVRLPEPQVAADGDAVELIQEILSTDSAEILKQLKDAQALPRTTQTENQIRHNKVTALTNQLHLLGQGQTAPHLDISHLANFRPVAGGGNRRARLEALGEQYPVIGLLIVSASEK